MQSLGHFFVLLLVINFSSVANTLEYPWMIDSPRYPTAMRQADSFYAKRMMPVKERRAPSDFEDFGNMMRSIDAIQKPRFG